MSVTGLGRKHLIKVPEGCLPVAGQVPLRSRSATGPPPAYEALLPFIKALWQAGEQPCGKRLRPILRDWLPYWKKPTGRSPPPTACFSKSQRGPA